MFNVTSNRGYYVHGKGTQLTAIIFRKYFPLIELTRKIDPLCEINCPNEDNSFSFTKNGLGILKVAELFHNTVDVDIYKYVEAYKYDRF